MQSPTAYTAPAPSSLQLCTLPLGTGQLTHPAGCTASQGLLCLCTTAMVPLHPDMRNAVGFTVSSAMQRFAYLCWPSGRAPTCLLLLLVQHTLLFQHTLLGRDLALCLYKFCFHDSSLCIVCCIALVLLLPCRTPLDVLRVDTEDRQHRFAVCVASYGYMGDLMKDSERLRWMGPARYNIAGAITLFQGKVYSARVSWLPATLA